MAEPNLNPAATLIRSRCLELGLNKARLVRLAGYKNEAKGIRRLNNLVAGDLETQCEILFCLLRFISVVVGEYQLRNFGCGF